MYFVVIMAFALVLTDGLPPERLNLLGGPPWNVGRPLWATLAVVALQLLVVAGVGLLYRQRLLRMLDGTEAGHERASNLYAAAQRRLLVVVAIFLVATLLLTPWAGLARSPEGWGLGAWPLVGDLLVLAPFFVSILLSWSIFFDAEQQLRQDAWSRSVPEAVGVAAGPPQAHRTELPLADSAVPAASATGGGRGSAARQTLAAARRQPRQEGRRLPGFLLDKLRLQVLIVAAPMTLIVFARHFTDVWRERLTDLTGLAWLADGLLGVFSVIVLGLAPFLLRYIWITEPLPAGELRDRFVRTCRRIGLSYREILLWHTHGLTINAAVMGFCGPLRYILVSDALLETMDEDEIAAVFGHEAGHIRHWHLQYFVLFAMISMYLAGGAMHLLWLLGHRWQRGMLHDGEILELAALGVLLACWLFGFSWLSRQFERQADVHGVRSVAHELRRCVGWCPWHSASPASAAAGLCVSAANLFGRTLSRIADLNGIPRDAGGWRHPSIEQRCRLIERLATDPVALRRFDRRIVVVKAVLIIGAAIGTALAAWLYGGDVLRVLQSRLSQ